LTKLINQKIFLTRVSPTKFKNSPITHPSPWVGGWQMGVGGWKMDGWVKALIAVHFCLPPYFWPKTPKLINFAHTSLDTCLFSLLQQKGEEIEFSGTRLFPGKD
jgi:hypothetical protein